VQAYREFESHPLRQTTPPAEWSELRIIWTGQSSATRL